MLSRKSLFVLLVMAVVIFAMLLAYADDRRPASAQVQTSNEQISRN